MDEYEGRQRQRFCWRVDAELVELSDQVLSWLPNYPAICRAPVPVLSGISDASSVRSS